MVCADNKGEVRSGLSFTLPLTITDVVPGSEAEWLRVHTNDAVVSLRTFRNEFRIFQPRPMAWSSSGTRRRGRRSKAR